MPTAVYTSEEAQPPTTELEQEFRHLGLSLLGIQYDHTNSILIQNRRFRSHYGTGWVVVAHLWRELESAMIEIAEGRNIKKKHLLWCLYFFKLYDTEATCATRFHTTEKTFRERCRQCIDLMALLEPSYVSFNGKKIDFFYFDFLTPFLQIKLENRYKDDIRNDCLLSVDTTDCRICELYPFIKSYSKIWSSHKFGKKAGVRYELALGIRSGDICWINGPFPCGLYNDWKIFNQCGLRSCLEEHERVEADRGYSAGDPEVCKTPDGCFHPKEKKEMRNRIMGRQETVFARFKNFDILNKPFRVKAKNLEIHRDIFSAIAVIIQIGIQHGDAPLYSCSEYAD